MHPHARSYAEFVQAGAEYEANKRQQALTRERAWRAKRAEDATRKLPNAVRRGDLWAVKTLIARGADHNVRGSDGVSMLELALANNRNAVAAFLEGLASSETASETMISDGDSQR